MLQRIEVESYSPTLPLPIGGGATDDPIQVRNIDGLGPVKAALTSTAFATGRGSYFQGGSIPERNIVLTLGLNPNWTDQTVTSLRKLLYGYFMPEQWCKLRFFTDDYPDVAIEGICESVEPNIFSEDPEIQVSIIHHQPDFVAIDDTVIDGSVTNALIDGDPTEYEFEYEGNAPAGFVLAVRPSPSNPDYTGPLLVVLETADSVDNFQVNAVTIDATKYLIFGTWDNDRKIQTVDETGAIVDILLKEVEVGSNWMKLKPGQNILAVSAEENFLAFKLTYFARYGGL